jgi:mono/diheme cytochrome c family protein
MPTLAERNHNESIFMKARIYQLQVLVLLIAVLPGCERAAKHDQASHGEQHGTPANWKFTLPAGNPSEGRKLFTEAECHKCHEVKGETFPEVAKEIGDIGPELSQMAGMHPPEFFAEAIINPNAVIDEDAKEKGHVGVDGKSKMPDFSDIFTVRQLADIAAYLTSLKKGEGGQKSH